jgi:GNAT superfamily N-acetyltransferase
MVELRRAPLPQGRTLTIRSIEAGDADAIEALYAGLDPESRYRRFFSAYRPDRAFSERVASVADRGGVGLVAWVRDEDGEHLVGEAGYELLANGDGELAITVRDGWRGWLGPYLLDALAEEAAARGVPNLEADVLATNGPMLAMLRARGCANLPTDDWTVVRAMIGTETTTPVWPASARGVRVLVEGAGGHWHGASRAAEHGLDVLGCPGPAHGSSRCPALSGTPCPLASGADVIVVHHPPDADPWVALRTAHAEVHPGVPVCVEVPRSEGAASPNELEILPCTDAEVVAIVERVARRHRPRPEEPGPDDSS